MIEERFLKVDPEHGLLYTLSEMNRLERLSFTRPTFVKFVHEKFSGCVPCYPGKIWEYMQKNFYYLPDEHDETIRAPYVLLKDKQGDCDDFSLFAKTCLDILGGWNTNYLLLGKTPGAFSHVVTFANRGKSFFKYIDPVIIDGANNTFNFIKDQYKFRKLV